MAETSHDMTLAEIRKRFDSGSWDSADLAWLSAKAGQHAEMLQVLNAAYHALRSYEFGNTAPELAREVAAECEAAIRTAEEGS
jgi:hypothetical protein